ncbi:PAS domain S-box protein, partial [archaeon]|nr:PAS domain S-box protein [archaeon]
NFVGKYAFDFITQKDKIIAMTNFKKAIDDELLYCAEYKLLCGDNTTIIGGINGVCIKDIDGNKTGILTTIRNITKRKKMEKKLMESEMRYRLLFENTKDAIFILDTESKPFGRIISANNAAVKIYGYNIEELQKSNIRNLEDSITKKESQHRIEKLIHGESITTELIHIKKDKTKFHVEISASPIELNNHKYILTNIRDITLRKKSEKNLNETKNYLETIIQMSSNGIFVIDEKGNFEFGNPACTNICGWKSHELIGKPFMQLIHPKYHKFMFERWVEAQNNNAKPYETVIITKNGKHKHISVSHQAIEFNGQRKYVDIIKDITVRKKMDAQKEFLEKVIENCTDAIVSIDMSYLISSWNPAAEKLFGFKKEEILGKNIIKHLVPKELKFEREKLIYNASKNGSASIKTKRYRKDKTLVSVILTISPIHDDMEQLIGYSSILKDLQSIQNNSDI